MKARKGFNGRRSHERGFYPHRRKLPHGHLVPPPTPLPRPEEAPPRRENYRINNSLLPVEESRPVQRE